MKIAFLGDSITLGYGLTDKKERFATLVANMLQAEEINLGITGTLVARAGLNRTDKNAFIDRLPLIKGADIAIVFGGTNDYFWSDRPIFPKGENDGTDYFYTALCNICESCRTVYKDIRVLFVTPYRHHGIGNFAGGEDWHQSSEHDTSEENFNGHVLGDYSDAVAHVAEKYGFPVLNLHEKSNFFWKKHTIDGCHPNPEGHLVLAREIAAFIKEHM